MGGKKKHVDDVGMSKTARASMAKKGKSEGFQASGELQRVYSLAGGEYARVLDPRTGKSHHLQVGSQRWNLVMTELLDSNHGDRIRGELLGLGMPFPVSEEV